MDWLFGFTSSSCLQNQYNFTTEYYRLWAKGRNQESNMMAYFDMVKERNYATRLEF